MLILVGIRQNLAHFPIWPNLVTPGRNLLSQNLAGNIQSFFLRFLCLKFRTTCSGKRKKAAGSELPIVEDFQDISYSELLFPFTVTPEDLSGDILQASFAVVTFKKELACVTVFFIFSKVFSVHPLCVVLHNLYVDVSCSIVNTLEAE